MKMDYEWECDVCEKTFVPLDNMRQRGVKWDDFERPDGKVVDVRAVCEICHGKHCRWK